MKKPKYKIDDIVVYKNRKEYEKIITHKQTVINDAFMIDGEWMYNTIVYRFEKFRDLEKEDVRGIKEEDILYKLKTNNLNK